MTSQNGSETINVEPNWEGMRRWVLHVHESDPVQARKLADAMGCEAPKLPDDTNQDN